MINWSTQQTDELERVQGMWHALQERSVARDNASISQWLIDLAELSRIEGELRAQGRWASGPSDLMGVLQVAFDEVKHCRVLAWLLDPNGAHQLGDRFLRQFIGDLSRRGVLAVQDDKSLGRVTVGVEEAKGTTRADIVVRSPEWMILIEAKILAGEQPTQGARLESLWAEGEPVLVFLTKTGRRMKTGSGRWIGYTWRDVKNCLRGCLEREQATDLSTAREYLKTLEAYFK